MKKILCLILSLTMCLSLCGCGGNSKAYKLSSEAFTDIQKAYEKIDQIGSDILAAWQLGIYSKADVKEWRKGFTLLCTKVSVSRDDCLAGLAYYEWYYDTLDGRSTSYDFYEESVYKHYDLYFDHLLERYEDSTFSACVYLVIKSYELNGTLGEIESLLSVAGEKIKSLSEHHSSYEHYKTVKEYYTTVNTYYNFCREPQGTLENATDNVNEYRNTVANCYNGLYYFFE